MTFMHKSILREIGCRLAFLLLLVVPLQSNAAWEIEQLEKNVTLHLPAAEGKHPLIIVTQGTGAIGGRERAWADWFSNQSIAVALVNSAGLRGRKDLSGLDSFFDYSSDTVDVLNWLSAHEKIDTRRFGIIGFSRGGTMALMTGKRFPDQDKAPGLVFAFYPGAARHCPNTYGPQTAIHIFYGNEDEWGIDQGLQEACKGMAGKAQNASYHELPGAHHGFDQRGESTFVAERKTFRKKFNEEALEASRSIIRNAMTRKWEFQNEQ